PPGRRNDNPAASIRPTLGPIGGRSAGLPQGSASFHDDRLPEEEAAMYRIFKKQSDRAARGSEGRPRRPRRARLGLQAPEGGQLLSLSPTVIPVNTFTTGTQFESDTASSAAGSVVVWTAPGVDSSRRDIHAQMFKPDGTTRGAEFVVNTEHQN